MSDDLKIIIGADIVPTKYNEEYFSNGRVDKIIDDEISKVLKESDYIALNLECPLLDRGEKIEKAGPHIKAKESTIRGLKMINPYFFTLANNHIMDYGEEGLKKTCELLDDNNLQYCGVGQNINELKKHHIAHVKNKKIGFFCCVENEFSTAGEQLSGANSYDPLCCFDDVKKLKRSCDYVIVLYHGGKEHYRYPSPNMRRVFRKFGDSGADLVIAQHTHCIGCMEKYNDSMLIYGQGNFVFDDEDDEFWNSSLLVRLNIDMNNEIKYDFIPCVKENHYVRIASSEEADKIINEFMYRSSQIDDDEFVKQKFVELIEREKKEYFYRLSGGFSKLFIVRLINKLSNYKFVKRMYGYDNRSMVRNCIECETHREIVIELLKE